ncbi:hypothetical protein KBY28_06770 [Ruegeria pomeroyi]|uniref:hypothetical protein n=1 Tax=Ruegeria pomeroyi TaxID=89184 RepID=UPI001F40CB09|nr:hypothetical protein [Ruegeria pomeroyi]MCE8508147.1 hypothetical protein [Ruegeria pomeroyi]
MLPSITFSVDRSAAPEERNEGYAAAKNRLFFGIGDTLGFLSAAVLAQESSSFFGKDELGSIAYDTSFDLLAGHPKRKDFQSWVDQSTNETRSATLHDETFDFAVLAHLQQNERGSFWHSWYQGFLDGKPLDWELQRRVALIDDAIWEAGPEAVAQEIARIERLFELEREIAALKDMLPPRSALSSTSLIGDNGGPPLDDGVQRAVRGDFVLVWDQIEDLEAEIAKPEPSPGRLKAIAKTLWEVSLRIAAYCGGKIDLALTEASKEAGKAAVKWGARVGAASLAAQNEGIQQVFKAIWAFVKTLPPG